MSQIGRIFLIITLSFLVMGVNYTFDLAKAQSGSGAWSIAKQIPNYDPIGRAPVMVADTQGQIHAFNDQRVGAQRDMVIYYRTWNLEQGWTTPVDVIYRGRLLNAVVQDALVDEWGILHLIFFEGDPTTGTIQYTKAPADIARQARAWSKPRLISDGAGPITHAALISLRPGNLTILFSGQADGFGLYEIHSDDRGDNWSNPELVYRTSSIKQWVAAIRAHVDQRGWLHAVWGVVNDEGRGDAVYYARYLPETERWDQLTTIATREGSDYSTTWPAVITDNNGQVIVVYMDSFPAAKFYRLSKDGGETWSVPIRPFPHLGEYEHPVLLKDSNQVVHIVLGNRLSGDPDIHGMWHGIWQNNRWSDLRPIDTGPKTIYFDPSAPKAVISMGNIIMASWWHDTSNEFRSGAWYSYITLDAPRSPVVTPWVATVMPTQAISPFQSNPNGELTTPVETVLPVMDENPARRVDGENNITQNIFLSLIPVFLVISFLILYRRFSIRTS